MSSKRITALALPRTLKLDSLFRIKYLRCRGLLQKRPFTQIHETLGMKLNSLFKLTHSLQSFRLWNHKFMTKKIKIHFHKGLEHLLASSTGGSERFSFRISEILKFLRSVNRLQKLKSFSLDIGWPLRLNSTPKNFREMPKLKSLWFADSINTDGQSTQKVISKFLDSCPNLERLTYWTPNSPIMFLELLQDFPTKIHLKILKIRIVATCQTDLDTLSLRISKFSSLRKLSVEICRGSGEINLYPILKNFMQLKNLACLKFNKDLKLKSYTYRYVFKHDQSQNRAIGFDRLEKLKLEVPLYSQSISTALSELTPDSKLKHLGLWFYDLVDYEQSQPLATCKSLKNLKQLDCILLFSNKLSQHKINPTGFWNEIGAMDLNSNISVYLESFPLASSILESFATVQAKDPLKNGCLNILSISHQLESGTVLPEFDSKKPIRVKTFEITNVEMPTKILEYLSPEHLESLTIRSLSGENSYILQILKQMSKFVNLSFLKIMNLPGVDANSEDLLNGLSRILTSCEKLKSFWVLIRIDEWSPSNFVSLFSAIRSLKFLENLFLRVLPMNQHFGILATIDENFHKFIQSNLLRYLYKQNSFFRYNANPDAFFEYLS